MSKKAGYAIEINSTHFLVPSNDTLERLDNREHPNPVFFLFSPTTCTVRSRCGPN
jgi:hypothetical protein